MAQEAVSPEVEALPPDGAAAAGEDYAPSAQEAEQATELSAVISLPEPEALSQPSTEATLIPGVEGDPDAHKWPQESDVKEETPAAAAVEPAPAVDAKEEPRLTQDKVLTQSIHHYTEDLSLAMSSAMMQVREKRSLSLDSCSPHLLEQ